MAHHLNVAHLVCSVETQREYAHGVSPPRFTVTPVLNDHFRKDQLRLTTTKDNSCKYGPPPSNELTDSPRSLADKLIRASKFETSGTVNTAAKGGTNHRGERPSRPSSQSRDDTPNQHGTEPE